MSENLSSKIDSIIKSKSTKQPGGVLNNENVNSVKNTNSSNHDTNNYIETQSNISKIKNIDVKTRNEFPNLNLNKKNKSLLPYSYINKTNNFPEKVLQKYSKDNQNEIKYTPNSLSEKKITLNENNFVQITKNLKVKDIERNPNKDLEVNEELNSIRLLKHISKNATRKEPKINEQKISEKIIQKSVYNDKIEKRPSTKDKKISVSSNIKNYIKTMGTSLKEQKIKLANFEYTKVLPDKGLSLSDEQNFSKMKGKDIKQSLNQINIKAVDCNIVNLNSLDVPNIDIMNLYDTSNNNINFNMPTLTGEIKDLIVKILVPDPDKRISLEDMKKHPYFKDISFLKVYKKEYGPILIKKMQNKEEKRGPVLVGDNYFEKIDEKRLKKRYEKLC